MKKNSRKNQQGSDSAEYIRDLIHFAAGLFTEIVSQRSFRRRTVRRRTIRRR
jgi:hypothetical protein